MSALQDIAPETRLTVVLDRDIYEEKDGVKTLLARKGERITPEVARKHGVLPIESAGLPTLESKVVVPDNRQKVVAISHKGVI
jgi:hypothetical protein